MADGGMTLDVVLEKYHQLDAETMKIVNWLLTRAGSRAYYEGYMDAKRGEPMPDSDSWEPAGNMFQDAI